MPRRKKTTTPEATAYRAVLNVLGKNHEGTGATARDAIANIVAKNCKGRGVLTVTHGDKTKERILLPHLTFRLCNTYGLMREIALKNTSLLFEGL